MLPKIQQNSSTVKTSALEWDLPKDTNVKLYLTLCTIPAQPHGYISSTIKITFPTRPVHRNLRDSIAEILLGRQNMLCEEAEGDAYYYLLSMPLGKQVSELLLLSEQVAETILAAGMYDLEFCVAAQDGDNSRCCYCMDEFLLVSRSINADKWKGCNISTQSGEVVHGLGTSLH